MTVSEVIEKAFNYGLPTVLLIGLVFGIVKAVAWLGPNFLTPIKDQIVIHLSKLDSAIDSMMLLIRGQTDALEKQNHVLHRVETSIEEAGNDAHSNTEVLNRIDRNVQDIKRNATRFFEESHTDFERHHDDED